MGDGDEDVNESRAEGSALLLFGEQLSEQQQKKRVRGERGFSFMASDGLNFGCFLLPFSPLVP